MATKKALLQDVGNPAHGEGFKVTVVGCGAVGMACIYSILNQNLCGTICLLDISEDKVKGEGLDLQDAAHFTNTSVTYGTDYALSEGSKIVVVTAGARQAPGEDRLALVAKNVKIFQSIIPPIMEVNDQDLIFLIVSNPVDVLTFVTWKLSGLPHSQVIGSGTTLDSGRFRELIAQRLSISSQSVHGWIIGEHGDSSVPLWSCVNVAGVTLKDLNPKMGEPDDPENWGDIHKDVVESAYKIIELKGYTSWAIGLSVSTLVRAILYNSRQVFPVSTFVKGCKHEADKDIFMSLPVVLGINGVEMILKMVLSPEEQKKLHDSASALFDVQASTGL